MDGRSSPEHGTLSLCLIVRDVERSLGRALDSARPFMDEMVVVDTGSVDRTREIAHRCGARVVPFAWCDDFSKARNRSLEEAGGDWIFWMDADDVLPPDSGRELRRLIAEHPDRDAAFWVTVEESSLGADGRMRSVGHAHVKLFPRHPAIRFCYRVHEQVAPAIQRLGLPLKPSRARVRHERADRSPEATEARLARNWRLLQLDLADRPDDPVLLLNLGMTAMHWPDRRPQAIECLKRSLGGLAPGSSTLLNAYLLLAQAYGQAGDAEAERHTCLKALEQFPDDAVLRLRLGGLEETRGALAQAAEHYRALLTIGKLRLSVVHLRDAHVRAALRLGRLYLRMGRPEQARHLWCRFLEQYPEEDAVRSALADLALRNFTTTTG